jgi:ubiquinone/menaquinone biosynthesis C-methylase UbiE
MKNNTYNPETYWSAVANRMAKREKNVILAGDDEPYYEYKRVEFLSMLKKFDFKDKNVCEIGCGPGGNLAEVLKLNPKKLTGVDISADMLNIAKSNLNNNQVEFHKTNGTSIEIPTDTFDVVFTATVLQHNTDEEMLAKLIAEIARISKHRVVFFERVESKIMGDDLCKGRPVRYYESIMNAHGYKLLNVDFINIRVSYYICGALRKIFNGANHQEGEPLNSTAYLLQKITLPITKILDKIFTSKKDIAAMSFIKQ